MKKPLVFISHITAEKEVALALKSLVGESFMGMIEVFVSSDPDSISMGGKWLDEITIGLKKCAIEIVLASPTSVRRPWINFEAGAGWVRDVPVIPICHSGMKPSTLPAPLSSLQAALATDAEQLQRIFAVLANAIDCRLPEIDFASFISCVADFERTSAKLDVGSGNALKSGVGGLSDLEIATLVALAESSLAPGETVHPEYVRRRMNNAGYRDIAASLGLAGLLRKGLVESRLEGTGNFDEVATELVVHDNGWLWLNEHVELIKTRLNKEDPPNALSYEQTTTTLPPSDEIPF